jgi:hypothetical protein
MNELVATMEAAQGAGKVDALAAVARAVPRCELAGLQPGPRSTRRCDGDLCCVPNVAQSLSPP